MNEPMMTLGKHLEHHFEVRYKAQLCKKLLKWLSHPEGSRVEMLVEELPAKKNGVRESTWDWSWGAGVGDRDKFPNTPDPLSVFLVPHFPSMAETRSLSTPTPRPSSCLQGGVTHLGLHVQLCPSSLQIHSQH